MWKLFTFYLTDKSFAIHYLNYSKKEMKIFVVTLFCLSYRATRNVLPELRMPRQSFVTSRPESLNWLDIIASQCNQVLSRLVCQYLYIFSFALHHELGPRLTDRVGLHSPLGLHLLFVSVFTRLCPPSKVELAKRALCHFLQRWQFLS